MTKFAKKCSIQKKNANKLLLFVRESIIVFRFIVLEMKKLY